MEDDSTDQISIAGINPHLLFGTHDTHLLTLEKRLGVRLIPRGDNLKIEGETRKVQIALRFLNELKNFLVQGYLPEEYGLSSILDYVENGDRASGDVDLSTVVLTTKQRAIRPRSLGQCLYVSAIKNSDVVFCIGPAGTGKTYLAVATAVASLKEKRTSRLVLVRPAVEAGESLGYLPGDLKEKVDPYFRPLYDALHDALTVSKLAALIEDGTIEIAPLAYMRGRTLNNAIIILDEAQNTTSKQMKMFLTRLGHSSKAIITGDITQVDLSDEKPSGLVEIFDILKGIDGIRFVYLTDKDVVRHRLVREIIKAYDYHEKKE